MSKGKQVKGVTAWQAAFPSTEGHWSTSHFPSALFKITYTQPWWGRVTGAHHRTSRNLTRRSQCCPEPEWSVAAAGAAAVAVVLNPGSPPTIKLANVFHTFKLPASDSAVALALTDVYWCFHLPKDKVGFLLYSNRFKQSCLSRGV